MIRVGGPGRDCVSKRISKTGKTYPESARSSFVTDIERWIMPERDATIEPVLVRVRGWLVGGVPGVLRAGSRLRQHSSALYDVPGPVWGPGSVASGPQDSIASSIESALWETALRSAS